MEQSLGAPTHRQQVRMDAVFYLMDALDRFAGMDKTDIGQVTM